MTKSKKILAGVLTAVIAVGAVSGIVLGVRAANRQPVMVVSAGELNYGGGWYSSEMQGMITSDVSQDVYLTDTQTVSEVMVKEGDTVQEGDVLLTYDTAMTSLNLEREKLNRQQIDLKVQVAQENLKKLRNTKPVSDNGGTGGWTDDPGILFPENPGEGGFPGVPEEPEPTEEPTPTPTPTEAPVSEYRVRFHSNGHGTVPEDVLLEKGQSFQNYLNGLKEEEKQAYLLTEEGYVFGGWYKDQICTVPFDPEETLTEDTELYARWSLAVPDYSQVEALGTLTAEAEAYNASEAEYGAMLGTAVNPYRYLCKDGAVIQADFMNALMMKATEAAAQNPEAHYYFVLEVHEGDKVGGKLLKAWMQDAAQISAEYPPDWQGKLNLATGNVDVSRVSAAASGAAAVSLKTAEPQVKMDSDYDSAGLGLVTDGMTYTKEELEAAIREQEETLKSLQLDQKESDLKIQQAEKAMEDGVVRAKLNGVVKKAGDPENPPGDGSAFLQVNSTEGMFVRGGISELRLDELKEGDTLTVMSWQSGAVCDAVVKEISPYPDESGMFSMGDNASYYPFTAYIESEVQGFSSQEWVSLTVSGNAADTMGSSDALYLWNAFIREENGEKYVYLRDENGKLKKQTITVGQLSGSGYEILSGVTWDDWLAFPYGQEVREGAATREGSMSELYGY